MADETTENLHDHQQGPAVFLMRQAGSGSELYKRPVMQHGVEIGREVLVFTSEAIADQFAAAMHISGWVSMPAGQPRMLYRWLLGVANNGVSYVCIDPVANQPESGHREPIADILDPLRDQFGDLG